MDNQDAVPPVPPVPPAPNMNPGGVQAPNVPGGQKHVDSASQSLESSEKTDGGTDAGAARSSEMMKDVLDKIRDSENVLVALSANPSVDEMAAAIGLTLVLNNDGKHATAIYSGKTPNVLEFLKPEETFEVNTNSLQDFIIALNKDKADHLRYKIDGDFVKVYITPYKTTLDESDLEFSRGDFNVDLVISLNVPVATDLDGALKEYGRIMHDAGSINITNGIAGKFGDLEWADESASSISEMVTKLVFDIDKEIDSSAATALLTGLVSATDKFTNAKTTPEVMKLSAKLMEAGADQQDVIKNISQELKFKNREDKGDAGRKSDDSEISISHASDKEEKDDEAPEEQVQSTPEAVSEVQTENDTVQAAMPAVPQGMSVAGVDVAATAPESGYNGGTVADQILNNIQGAQGAAPVAPETQTAVDAQPEMQSGNQVVGDNMTITPNSISADYGKMIDEALAEPLPGEANDEPTQAANSETPAGESVFPAGMEMPGAGAGNENEFPPIIPTGGTLGYQSPAAMGGDMQGGMQGAPEMPVMNGESMSMGAQSPEMGQANSMAMPTQGTEMGMNPGMSQMPNQEVEAGANPAAMQAPVLPMPGQELAPPPMAPMPDFGTLPPVQGMPTMAPAVSEGVSGETPSAPTQPVQPPAGTSESGSGQAPLGSFQIPGM